MVSKFIKIIMTVALLNSCLVVTVAAGNVKQVTSKEELTRIMTLQSIADPSLPPAERVDIIVSKMTLIEKIRFLSGYKGFFTYPIQRLGLRPLKCVDASQGIRANGRATAFPGSICYASSFNKELANKVGQVISEECRAKGVDVLLGPGVNIQRIPTNGRNYEYMGEDPFLTSAVAVEFIKGIQKNGVVACVKHFAANNSDNDRHRMNAVVDERTLHEIYFPAFKAAVTKGDVKSVMTAYNPLNGISSSENHYLMTEILKEKWGFNYFVISDWISLYNTYEPFSAGLDLEMPKGQFFNYGKLKPLLRKGKITEAQIDEKVKRILLPFFEFGSFDRIQRDRRFLEYGGEHDDVATQVAQEGVVLLKNSDNILPLNKDNIKKIVLVGPNARNTPTSGGGAGWVIPFRPTSFFNSIRKHAGENVEVRFTSIHDAENIKSADVVIYCGGWNLISEEEYLDRTWNMTSFQAAAIRQVSKINPNVIVAVNCGGGFEIDSWVHNVKAVLDVFYLGQSGDVFGQIIFGKVSPSGKLPFTIGKKWEDYSAVNNYLKKGQLLRVLPGLPISGSKALRQIWDCKYEEGVFMGYRDFQQNDVEPAFAFGYGLSYSKFEYSNFKISKEKIKQNDKVTVSLDIKNVGDMRASESIQFYVSDLEASVPRPKMELKEFGKVFLEKGETKKITITLDKEAFSFYDVKTKSWIVEPGEFEIKLGVSSDNIIKVFKLEITE